MHCDMRAFAPQIMEEVQYSENREHPGNIERLLTENSYPFALCL